MNAELIWKVEKMLAGHPLYSQEGADLNPVIHARLFNAAGAGTWLIAEYDPLRRLAFGYASIFGDHCDEWGYISLEELASLRFGPWYCIEVDAHFVPRRFRDLRPPL